MTSCIMAFILPAGSNVMEARCTVTKHPVSIDYTYCTSEHTYCRHSRPTVLYTLLRNTMQKTLLHLLHGRVHLAVSNVVKDGVVEHDGVLGHHSYGAPDALLRRRLDVVPVHQNLRCYRFLFLGLNIITLVPNTLLDQTGGRGASQRISEENSHK